MDGTCTQGPFSKHKPRANKHEFICKHVCHVRVVTLVLQIYYLSLQHSVTFRTLFDRVKSPVHMIRQDTGKRLV